MPPRVTVVIPNWNGERFLRLCLGSLRDQSFRAFETILVDNGSVDGSIAFVKERFPEVSVVPLGENLGIAAAFNAAIEASTAEYVVLLNNDTEQDQAGWKRWCAPLRITPRPAFLRASWSTSTTVGCSTGPGTPCV